MAIKFISYDGEYPNLCSGTLVLEVDGVVRSAQRVLVSTGCINWEDDTVTQSDWALSTHAPQWMRDREEEVLAVVNANVPKGCCGGCI
ncbi:MAG: hypothetical protein IKB97_05365 [Bacteroidaceae bacterium]|nr:hypothetical protein [Bacteroidaceae bacterium]